MGSGSSAALRGATVGFSANCRRRPCNEGHRRWAASLPRFDAEVEHQQRERDGWHSRRGIAPSIGNVTCEPLEDIPHLPVVPQKVVCCEMFAAMTVATRMNGHPLKEAPKRMLRDQKPHLARLTLARRL